MAWWSKKEKEPDYIVLVNGEVYYEGDDWNQAEREFNNYDGGNNEVELQERTWNGSYRTRTRSTNYS